MDKIAPAPIPPRLPDWRPRLAAYVSGVARQKFKPGAQDCALFVAGAVLAMTGHDPAADWRGRYRTLSGGKRRLRGQGFADHIAFVEAHLAEIPPAFAAVGDVAVLPGDGAAPALGLVQGDAVYCLRAEGLVVVSRLAMERAFRL